MRKRLLSLLIFSSLVIIGSSLIANNILVSNTELTGQNATDDYVMVKFNLSWENSWRTSSAPYNWDAAWVFVKYRVATGEWYHANLSNTGHSATSATIDAGLLSPDEAYHATTNPGVGVFVYRSGEGSGNFSVTGAQLRWNYGANGLADNAIVDVQVFAIEMVYVPEGFFYVGTGGTEVGSFTNGSWTSGATIALAISSENQLTIGPSAGSLWGISSSGSSTIGDPGILAGAFPKGYEAFYCMKYEISQQGYVDFLNTLPTAQATSRYPEQTTNRHAITVTDGVYSTGNPYVACNFLGWPDVAAYLDWAGLRPMTELEFEKACRGPNTPVANEFAWGSTTIVQNTGITDAGAVDESSANSGNCTYGNHASVQGPMRVGAFASVATTKADAGASWYGLMELSGNVYERPITVGNDAGRSFTGAHGDGSLSSSGLANATTWPDATGDGACFRGGTWLNLLAIQCVSDRTEGALTAGTAGSDFGGRGVRSVLLPTLTTDAATDILDNSATSGGTITADAGRTILEKGVCWLAGSDPSVWNNHTSNGTGAGSFTSSLTGLTPGLTYYVRAYAITEAGTAYGNRIVFSTPYTCGSSALTISHVTTNGVAPVDKSVTYASVTGVPGETEKCWITRNLGASQQANSVDDNTEESAGWYWQFNRKQGYKHDGSARTPNTSWVYSISEDNGWLATNDPCSLELGGSWRLPTVTEWINVDGASGGNWTNWNGPFGSTLKLHAAGRLNYNDGNTLQLRGSNGQYWSSTNYTTRYARGFFFSSGSSATGLDTDKAWAFSLRCIREVLPAVTTTATTNITSTTASSGGTVTDEGAAPVTAYGVCWGITHSPTVADDYTTDGSGTGSFVSDLDGLSSYTTYYVRAYATNSNGTKYGTETSFTTSLVCGTNSITVSHVTTGGVAPVNKNVTYGTATNIPGETSKCWITRNLGATQQPDLVNDATEASAGWYWRFNRKQGYKYDGVCTPTWVTTAIDEYLNWTSSEDPCTIELGSDWRIPTLTEWQNVKTGGSWTFPSHAFSSALKLHEGGFLWGDLSYTGRGVFGYYWSSSRSAGTSDFGHFLSIDGNGNTVDFREYRKITGMSIRCLK